MMSMQKQMDEPVSFQNTQADMMSNMKFKHLQSQGLSEEPMFLQEEKGEF